MRAALLFLTLCAAALVAVSAAATPAHGGGKGARGDGFFKPLKSNSAWKYYSFDIKHNNAVTSVRPSNSDLPDANTRAGTIVTAIGELFLLNGEKVGIRQLKSIIVGDDNVLGSGDTVEDRVVTTMVNVAFEFGTEANGYYDDVIFIAAVDKHRPGASDLVFEDVDAVVVGGRGRFLGATGEVRIVKIGEEMVKHFEVWVANNFPR